MTEAIPNADQIDYWNGEVGRRWAALQNELDALFTEVTAAAITAAAPQIGESVIDIGCGCGGSLLALSRFLGPTGRVLGLDISEPMLAVARQRVGTSGLDGITLRLADAAAYPFEPTADLAFSRFGAMFFDAPARAFANIRKGLKPDGLKPNGLGPGGRLALVCWQAYKDNPLFSAPHWAAKAHLPPDETPKPDPDAPGPFAFADPERVRRILDEAGFADIAIEPAAVMLPLAGSGEVEAATRLVTQIGPVARLMATGDDDERRAAEAAVREAIAPYDGPDGVRLPARLWVVRASA